MQVTKRDGRIMEFCRERIVNAVMKAMMQTAEGADIDLANKIAISIEKQLENKDQASVYEIQDLVEKKLMGSSRKEVAQAYITYRYNRDIARKSKTREVFLDIISSKSNDFDSKNSSYELNTPAIIMSRFAKEVSKPYVDNFLLTKEARDAQKDGYIFVCNKDYYLTKSLNSFSLPMIKHDFNDIEEIVNYYCVVINELTNEIHGKISIPAFDFYFAKYVRKTFIQEITKVGEDLQVDIQKLLNHKIKDYIKKDTKNLNDEHRIVQLAINRTVDRISSSMKSFIYNMISLQKEKQMIINSLNYGTDTSAEGRCIIRELINAIYYFLLKEKNNIPIQIWKKKKGINFDKQDKNYDLYLSVLKLIKEKMPFHILNLDASYNKSRKWKEEDSNRWNYECSILGDTQRVYEDINGENISNGKGVLSATIINLPKIAIESANFVKENFKLDFELGTGTIEKKLDKYKSKLKKVFMNNLEKYTTISLSQLYERYKFQGSAIKSQFPKLMSGLWINSDRLDSSDTVDNIIKHGTLALGFLGLAECLVTLTSQHHGESDEVNKFGLEIINEVKNLVDEFSEKYSVNFALMSAEDLSGELIEKDRVQYGLIKGITEEESYSTGNDIPSWYECTAEEKVKIESQYHELCRAGNIFNCNNYEKEEVLELMDKYNLNCIRFK